MGHKLKIGQRVRLNFESPLILQDLNHASHTERMNNNFTNNFIIAEKILQHKLDEFLASGNNVR